VGVKPLAGVTLRGLSKVYPNGVEAVSGVDLDVADGAYCAVVGPSGSGKSTLLRLVAGLEGATSGTILIGGRDLTAASPRDRDLAMVFQDHALYPHLSVFENLAFGLRARGVRGAELRTRVEAAAGPLGLAGLLGRRPETLSGGQRQRVGLGRAVVRRPGAFLFDEPLAGLDAPRRAAVRADLIDLRLRLNPTVIHVTHDQGEALALGDLVVVMNLGRVAQVGTPREVYERPADRFVAGFVGGPPMSLIAGRVEGPGSAVTVVVGDSGRTPSRLEPPARWRHALAGVADGRVELGVRPEHVRLAGEPGSGDGRGWHWPAAAVERAEYLGHETLLTLADGPARVQARVPSGEAPRPGDTAALVVDLDRASWFEVGSGRSLRPDPA